MEKQLYKDKPSIAAQDKDHFERQLETLDQTLCDDTRFVNLPKITGRVKNTKLLLQEDLRNEGLIKNIAPNGSRRNSHAPMLTMIPSIKSSNFPHSESISSMPSINPEAAYEKYMLKH